MSRINDRMEMLKANNEKALVAFVTAGDPDLSSTREIFSEIEKSGADIIELGVPFSDPLADGPVIQLASQRSLKSGTSLKKIIQLVKEIRQDSELPIVLMSSFNPVFVYGEKQFVDDAVSVGVDGVILPDLPPEEAGEFVKYADEKGLDMIFLVSPTSTPDRVKMISDMSKGFIYYVSLTGVTGVRSALPEGLEEKVSAVKSVTPLPVMIGFGISGPEIASEASAISDGVIVGSAIVKIIAEVSDPKERLKKVGNLVSSIKQSMAGISKTG
ncbi:MAG: tryptophan synthase subunit alpha [Nitrospinales bacterium]